MEAVKQAHSKNLFLRDLSTKNVLLFKDERQKGKVTFLVKLAHFGLSQIRGPELIEPNAEEDTSQYQDWQQRLAPELRVSSRTSDEAIDVYLLGKLLQEFKFTGTKHEALINTLVVGLCDSDPEKRMSLEDLQNIVNLNL